MLRQVQPAGGPPCSSPAVARRPPGARHAAGLKRADERRATLAVVAGCRKRKPRTLGDQASSSQGDLMSDQEGPFSAAAALTLGGTEAPRRPWVMPLFVGIAVAVLAGAVFATSLLGFDLWSR